MQPKNKRNRAAAPPVSNHKALSRKRVKAISTVNKNNEKLEAAIVLAGEINDYHKKAVQNEIDAAKNAWEAGTRLSQAFEKIGYGGWEKYLKKNCQAISRTSVWRYRQMASCFTLEQLSSLTLTEVYEQMKLVKSEKEPFSAQKSGGTKTQQETSPDMEMVKVLGQATKHFDHPEKLAGPEKDSLKRVLVRLVEVFNQIENEAFTWTDGEAELIAALYQKVQTQKAVA
jgi:hypothetical protein